MSSTTMLPYAMVDHSVLDDNKEKKKKAHRLFFIK